MSNLDIAGSAVVALGLNLINAKHITSTDLENINSAADTLKIPRQNRPPREVLMDIRGVIGIETKVMVMAQERADSSHGVTQVFEALPRRVRRWKAYKKLPKSDDQAG